MEYLEFFAMFFSMGGAYLMSRDLRKYEDTLYKANISFLVANIMLIFVSVHMGMVALLIQMLLFTMASSLNIYALSINKKRDLNILGILIAIILFKLFQLDTFVYEITGLEILAASMAISGSFIMKTKSDNLRLFMFLLFFVADLLYVYIAYDKGMIWFGIQSFFFLYTSLQGAYNTLKNKEVYHAKIS